MTRRSGLEGSSTVLAGGQVRPRHQRCVWRSSSGRAANADRDAQDVTDVEYLELVRHRCFVLSKRDSDDLYPYEECVRERDGIATLGW